MSIETAFSLELNKDISAIQANQLALKGLLSNPHAFRCNGSNDCKASLQCVNFNKTFKERVIEPYFKVPKTTEATTHSKDCKYKKIDSSSNVTIKSESQKNKLSNSEDIFLVLSSVGFTESVENYSTNQNSIKSNPTTKQSSSFKASDSRNINSNVKGLKKIIDLYLNENNRDRNVHLYKESVKLKDLFINLQKYPIIDLNLNKRIYFGKAKILEKKPSDPYLIIEFIINKGNKHNNRNYIKASMLVYKNRLQEHKHLKKFLLSVNTDKYVNVYFFGVPHFNEKFNKKILKFQINSTRLFI